MSEIRVNKVIDEAGTGAVELTQGATLPTGKTISGSGSLNITGNSTVGGNLSVGGVLTYEDVTNVDSIGIITAQSGIHVTSGITSIKGAAEKVNVGSFAGGILTLDASTGTVFTHDLQGQTVGIVSITNFPVVTNSFHTVTVIYNQNSAGTANTTPDVGVSTNITLTPTGVSGFSTEGLVGTGTTVILSSTPEDFDIVTYGIHYNGNATGTISNYKVFVTKSGDFRYG
jgi:hypothetical protein